MESKTPEQKIQAEFDKRAHKLAQTLVKWYAETGDIPSLKTSLIYRDDGQDGTWENGGWYVVLAQRELGSVEEPMK